MSEYINLDQLGRGCASGRISEWPMLAVEARKALAEFNRLRAENAAMRGFVQHRIGCETHKQAAKLPRCTCGLDDLLESTPIGIVVKKSPTPPAAEEKNANV